MKSPLREYSLLYHYVIGQDTELVVDVSETGLGAVPVQRASKTEPFRPVMYKSCSLKDEVTRYSPTEREALAFRWAVKKLRHYLFGAPVFRIVTDHRPLTHMFHKLAGKLPPRVEKFVMDLQELEYEVVYWPGKVCIADYMSRHHSNRKGSSNVFSIELHVKSALEVECCHVLTESSAVKMEDIKLEAERCEVYKKLREVVQSGIKDGGNSEKLKPYMVPEIKHELCVIDGIVCRGSRVKALLAPQVRVVELSHRGHQRMSKAKKPFASILLGPKAWTKLLKIR